MAYWSTIRSTTPLLLDAGAVPPSGLHQRPYSLAVLVRSWRLAFAMPVAVTIAEQAGRDDVGRRIVTPVLAGE